MKAILAEQAGRLGVVEIGEPQPTEEEALVEVHYVGLCGTDMHAYKGSHPFLTYPRVLGHEISGVLLAGPKEPQRLPTGIHVGDPVVVEPYINCRTCHMCRAGRTNACLQLKVLGVHIDGAMTQRIAVRADKVHRVPDGLSLRDAALAEPLGIGFHAARRGMVRAGQTVFIIGAGTIGRSVLAAAKQAGARTAISELIEQRIEAARRMGADLTLDAHDAAAMQRELLRWTDGEGPNVVIEAAGVPETVQQAIDAARPGGTVVLVGMTSLPVTLLTRPLMAKELNVYASRNSAAVLDELLAALAARRIAADSFVSHEIELSDVPAVLPDMCENPQRYLKVLVRV
jgi:2-desacetyl-2-hydroxyethyl bacteriochlorophyllide A dehydrogenase